MMYIFRRNTNYGVILNFSLTVAICSGGFKEGGLLRHENVRLCLTATKLQQLKFKVPVHFLHKLGLASSDYYLF
jgi:hypothetical protein